ncbi:Uncharacterized protein TCM_042513 [Theobroma cacao]|uniref:Uncharacterized protein n=1 Tax=Theobroma cacao TaxID=3641 RepID=A0A061FT65_THECC|nr:Uncharacterized protein TCM_042513 [Theobroma cacao]
MNTAAPFETDSAILTMFVITTLVYAVDWAIEAKLETRSNSYHHVILSNISLLLESLATVFLVLILVPALGYFILLIWAIYFVGLTYGAWRKLYLLYNAISSVSDLLNELLGRRGLHNEEIIQCSTSSGSSANYTHAFCIFLVAIFLALMNLKFLSVDIPSPFETHSLIMPMFVITILVYATNFHPSFFHEVIRTYISLLTGSLTPVLFALILLPGDLGCGENLKFLKVLTQSCVHDRVGDKTVEVLLLSAFKITYKGILTKAYTATSKFLTLLTKEETNLYEAAQSSMAAFNKCRMGGLWHKRASVLGKKRKPTE